MRETDVHTERYQKEEKDELGKAFAKDGAKAVFVRQNGRGDKIFLNVVSHLNTSIFNALMEVTAIELEELHRDVAPFINSPTGFKRSRSPEEMELKQPKNALRSCNMFYFSCLCCVVGTKVELFKKSYLLNLEYHQQQSALTSGMWKIQCLMACTKVNTVRYDGHVRWKEVKCVDYSADLKTASDLSVVRNITCSARHTRT